MKNPKQKTKPVRKVTKKKSRTNPNKANQYKVDPRQTLFLSYYLDPESETFSNALQSALRAGYEKRYAQNITHAMPTWLAENVGDDYLIKRAEMNLKEFVEMDTTQPVVTMVGIVKDENGEVVRKENPNLKRIKSDMTKFTLERLNKAKYSARTELAGKDGKNLVFTVTRDNDSH